MVNVNLKALVERLSPFLKTTLEGAAGLAMGRSHYNVELEHWLIKILETQDCDLSELLRRFNLDSSRVVAQLQSAIERFKNGNTRAPALSAQLVDAAKNGWLFASIEHNLQQASSAHLFAAALLDEAIRRQLMDAIPAIRDLPAEAVREAVSAVVGRTAETATSLRGSEPATGASGTGQVRAGLTPSLDKYTVNLTERAREGKIDPVLGRDAEIRQCIDILTRRRQNNPILTGEAGVGKTAVVEGLALRIAEDDVPTPLKGVSLRTLDLGLLQAGASVKGEFENRLRQVIDEVKASPQPIILFIDEAHTLIGAGGKEGQGDAANLLKPALARGELRTIAATTWAEYKKYFERDPALTRRFQVVKVEEPDEANAIDMMRGLAGALQKHHKVRIGDDAIIASVQLSHRYIPSRQLPDKSVSLLDTACARVALSHSATPAEIDDTKRRVQQLHTNIARLQRENASAGNLDEQITALIAEKDQTEAQQTSLEAQWEQEKAIINEITTIRDQLETEFHQQDQSTSAEQLSDEVKASLRKQLREKEAALLAVQGDNGLMSPHVNASEVAAVVANWTGIPVGKMVSNEIENVLNLGERLRDRVIGQDHALEAIAQVIRTSRAGLSDPRKPIGVFMMIGTSGVGKTETALALADMLYGGEQNLTVINMSEFKEEHKVSMLLGSPPGYVGYGEGGVLTEAARRKPYSVILLDEMEKAHNGVQDIFYNLFDKGTIKDGEGRDIDFKNTLIIMTTNAGEGAIRAIIDQEETRPEPDVLLDSIRPELLKFFKPAFLGRSSLVTYYPLGDEQLMTICGINMKRIAKRVRAHYGAEFSYDEDVPVHIVARSQEVDTGARNIENIISRTILPELASECLQKLANGESISSIRIGVNEEGAFSYSVN